MKTPPKIKDRSAIEHLYGCTVELAEDEAADDCVLDYGAPGDCAHAARRQTKWTCPYWILRSEYEAARATQEEAPHA